MYQIEYYLHHNKISWSATINQLNSDVLKRHILPRANTSFLDLNFSFCESESTGEIKNSQGTVLGTFYLSSAKGG
ncbi:hypothetical protein GCM10007938_26340 [Vibrio zhanjiangensis]|uniref:Uncharacterized protein n=1 Tax=Vibrio zhanjiangensis TaxID=1046128 RepID=A0ABQ6F2B2_9VIBR|nr:hypothetical protein GCM10007938_26340 [Vibrio zhanjiangensis]